MIEANKMDKVSIPGLWELPEGWEWVKMSNIAKIDTKTVNTLEKTEEIFSYLGLENVEKGQWTNVSFQKLRGEEIKSTCISFSTEHILYSKLRPNLNKVVVPTQAGIGSTEWLPLLTDPGQMEKEYLAWYLRNPAFVASMVESTAGSRMPRIYMETFWAYPVPIPFPHDPGISLDIQRRIVHRIETLLVDLQEAKSTLRSMRQDIDQVMNGVLQEVFEDSFDPTSSWKEQNVADFCDEPQYGYTQSATFEPIGPKFLRITDIQDNRVNWDLVPYCQIPENKLPTYLLQKGDILFARSGATTGKTFLIDECPVAVFASYLIRLRVKKDVMPELLAWFFQSKTYWDQIQLGGSAQPNMNAQLLKKVKVRYPQAPEAQQQVVAYLDSIQEGVRELVNTLQEDEEILKQVEQSILERAFHGEL